MIIKEIIELEEDNTKKCYLMKEGLFWRAYEKSAFWFVNKLKPYTITKKHFKGVVYLGFPDTVLSELLTLAQSKGYTVDKQEKLITINGLEMSEGFDKWKVAIPYQMFGDNSKGMVCEPGEKYDGVQGFAASKGIATLKLGKKFLNPDVHVCGVVEFPNPGVHAWKFKTATPHGR